MTQQGAPARRLRPEILAIKLVQAMDRTDDATVVQQSFQDIVEKLGFSSVTCATLPMNRHIDPGCILMSTRPAEWAEAYYGLGYAKHDPILREIIRGRGVVEWPQAFEGRKLSRREREVIAHYATYGMHFGMAMTIPGASGNVGFINLAGHRPCTDERRRSALTLVSIYVYNKLRALAAAARRNENRLSPRELEILHWIAEGKSDWQIGRILAISAKTVNYHTENVKRKFGVATRMQAVVSAIQRGELTQ